MIPHTHEVDEADITMCSNHTCPSRDICYRFCCFPNRWVQSYALFKPKLGCMRCEDFIRKEEEECNEVLIDEADKMLQHHQEKTKP